ncbi:carbohydrate-binding domain-containing protein [Belnapia rosea]|uniref:Hemolysin-type calcium-binding repeat-containing protein n=1 Tax=Belnapia rosea TaxID=938405 RepID=A0A1G6P026_9PROT|nr:carbohydrate-binding domain-containing protein [Belnapia rosea]SDC72797.1 Hemolysin-type calcium-binding repeat-containing protein [Belnapia rosea]
MSVITGTSAKDTIQGTAGSDTITGGAGADLLTGGAGADLFAFKKGDGADTITDFKLGTDRLSLSSGTYKPWIYETSVNGVWGTSLVYNASRMDTVFLPKMTGLKIDWLLDPKLAPSPTLSATQSLTTQSLTTTATVAPAFAPVALTAGSGSDSLVLKITQDAWNGSAQYVVKVDGVQIGGTFTASALHGSGQYDTLTLKGNWVVGTHKVEVTFLNDGWGGTADTDRNLYVEGATYNGKAVQSSALDLTKVLQQSFSFVEEPPLSAFVPVHLTAGTGPDTLVLKLSQDAWQGSAQYIVKVDGVQVGGTFTASALHSSGQSDTLTLKGDWAVGTHKVEVTFLNDGWGGTADTDRNLYIDSASYNGKAIDGSTLALTKLLQQNFTFVDQPPPSAFIPVNLTVGSGTDHLVLKISQDAWAGSAQYTVTVDGVKFGGTFTASALHSSGQYDTLTLKGDWSAGTHKVEVNFLNDGWGGSASTDRNLYVDGAIYNGKTVDASSLSLGRTGIQAFNFVEQPSFAPVNLTAGTGTDSLVLKLSQQAWSGSAQYTVKVDGTQIGGTFTASALYGSGQFDTLTLKGDWVAGTHQVEVNFLNDGWGGSLAADRNLYLDSATYNGKAVAESQLDLTATGIKSFSFFEAPPPSANLTLTGTADADTLTGKLGADTIMGGAGNDTITGDLGDDQLTGGSGADVFKFTPGDGQDVITDFKVGEDRLSFATDGTYVAWGETVTKGGVTGTLIHYGTSEGDGVFLAGVTGAAMNTLVDPNWSYAPLTGSGEFGGLVFQDEFSGTRVDSTKWPISYGNATYWNGAFRWDSSEVSVGNGALNIGVSKQADGIWTTGGISTTPNQWNPGFSFMYGKVEIMAKVSEEVWGAGPCFLLWPSADGVWPPEVDILETPKGGGMFTEHWADANGGDVFVTHSFELDLTQWHVYGLEWTPDRLTMTVDGQVMKTYTDNIPHQMMTVGLQGHVGAASETWYGGSPNDTGVNHLDISVDFVRVYDWLG